MEFVKKLINKKYFLIIVFFVLILIFSTMMFVTIQKDNEPPDGMVRNTAVVVDVPDGFGTETIEVNGDYAEVYRRPIIVEVKFSDSETITNELFGRIKVSQVPDLKIGTTINVKYSDDDHTKVMFAEEIKKQNHVFLYIVYSLVILGSAAGIVLFSRRNRIRDHRIVMEKNMQQMKEDKERAESGAFNSLDRILSEDDIYNPFSDSGIDYNARYENDKNIGESVINENEAYSAFGGGQDPGRFGVSAGNSSVPDYASFGAAGSAPAMTPSNTDIPADMPDSSQQFYGYGAPNPSMDAPVDPNAAYTGYGAPNPSMDQEYDPFAPYTGY